MQGGSVPSSYLLPFCPSVVDNFYLKCCPFYAECLPQPSYNYHSIHIFIIAMCVFLLTLHLSLVELFVSKMLRSCDTGLLSSRDLSCHIFPWFQCGFWLVCPYGIHRNKLSGPLSLSSMQVQYVKSPDHVRYIHVVQVLWRSRSLVCVVPFWHDLQPEDAM